MTATIRRLRPATADIAAHVTAALHDLPLGRVTVTAGAVHLFVTEDEFTAWADRHGHITHEHAGPGVWCLTLHTRTDPRDDGTTVPVYVQTLTTCPPHPADADTAA